MHDGRSDLDDEAVIIGQLALQQTTMQVLRQGSLKHAAALCDQQQQHHKPGNAQIRQNDAQQASCSCVRISQHNVDYPLARLEMCMSMNAEVDWIC